MEKHKKIDTKAIEYHIAGILKALGDNPEREGLIDTPKRVAKMYEEVFEGMNYTNEEIADMFNKTFALDRLEEEFENVECKSQNGNSDMVVVKDIDIFSYCEHHLALMYDMKVKNLKNLLLNMQQQAEIVSRKKEHYIWLQMRLQLVLRFVRQFVHWYQ